MRNILVYGSLRKGEYNYNAFKEHYGEDFKFEKEVILEGYKLYSLFSYPGIKKSENKNDTIVAEKFKVSEEAFKDVDAMEIGAGYSREIINIDGDDCVIYLYDLAVEESNLVEDGNWIKREDVNIW